ncbi:hypothetical protein OG548_23285 [Streptomyces sp. NBC_01356]|uniref:hypothetical protein n=1 Tax=Streptomyces sp. NBC_01356 TaxID=2903836 RepID=UPI002E3700AC|nr:hypothetical protein [Streptomyces sp. NBC_01356]
MSGTSTARLLPWAGPEGKPCYLVSDGNSHLSHVADTVEELQLGMAGELLAHAERMLADRKVTAAELRFLGARLSEALGDVVRVAESRGARLPVPDDIDGDDDDGPEPPAEHRRSEGPS